MADKSKEKAEKKALKKEAKEAKKKAKLEKKALKKEAKEAKKKAKLEKKGNKESKDKADSNSEDTSDGQSKVSKIKSFFSIKKLIIFFVVIVSILGSGFVVYKMYFTASDEPIVYKSIVLNNVNLPDEMLEFSFDYMNDLYFSFATYDIRIYLLNKEIERINKIGKDYPDQNSIAEKEKKDWIRAKEKVEKKFIKIEKQIKELYVLHIVNKDEGVKKIEEKKNDLLIQANEALETLDSYIEVIEANKDKEPQGFINNTINKVKNIF